jgi:hypothetical protein
MADDSTFAFAGLWESWTDPGGDVVETCTILTTTPNSLVTDVHNRMPVILRVQDYARWLDPSINNPPRLPQAIRSRSDEEISSQHSCEPPRERRPRMRAGSSLSSHSNTVLICGWVPEFAGTASKAPFSPQFLSQKSCIHRDNCVDFI